MMVCNGLIHVECVHVRWFWVSTRSNIKLCSSIYYRALYYPSTVQYAMLHLTHQLSHPDNSNQKGFTTSLLSLCSDTDSYTVPPMTQAFRLTGAEVEFLEDLRHEN